MIDYSSLLSRTVRDIAPSGIRRFFDIANTMEGVISLGVGEPDFRTPYKVRRAASLSLERQGVRYTANKGYMPLLSEISRYYNEKYHASYDPCNEIMVTVGGSEAIDMALRALINPGDEVIIPEPSYVCYKPMTLTAGGVPVIINTKEENDFKLTAGELRSAITERTKALILPYPSNPTGAVLDRCDIEAIYDVIKDTNIIVISDEIYSALTFTGKPHISVGAVSGMHERTVVVNGFSKSHSMTGWRLGYAMGPEPIISQMIKLHQYAIMCAPTTSQYAAIVALRDCDEEVEEMRREYDIRRKITVDGFRRMGLECREPKGAFYVFPKITKTGLTSEEFAEELLYKKKVAVVPGTAFGESGEGYVRVSYCYSLAHIKEALRRINEFVEELSLNK